MFPIYYFGRRGGNTLLVRFETMIDYRKELVENQKLVAVISMPSGVFKPYAGVSTAVLVFTKTNAGGTDKV